MSVADISTFSGKKADWSWFGDREDSAKDVDPKVIAILQKEWGKTPPLLIQNELDSQGISAEFIWKITPNETVAAEQTVSSYITDNASVASMVITMQSTGKGEIRLYSQDGSLVGRVRCSSTSVREGKNSQLAAGNYTVTSKEAVHVSKEFKGAKMPNALEIDADRGIFIHNGNIEGVSGGCIRVAAASGRHLFRLVKKGVSVKMVWK